MASAGFQPSQAGKGANSQFHTPIARRTPPDVTIRPREPNDCYGLYELFNERSFLEKTLMRDAFGSAEEINPWLNGIPAAKRFEKVVIRNDLCIGFGAIYVQGGPFDHCGAIMLGLRESFRGQGIGSLLLRTLLETAERDARLGKIQLTVVIDNVEAINLYRKHGFQFEGLQRRFARRDGIYLDAYCMALLMDPPRTVARAPTEAAPHTELKSTEVSN